MNKPLSQGIESYIPNINEIATNRTNIEPQSFMPPAPPPIGADKLSQFVFDNIIEGMANASANASTKPIKVDDIKLDELSEPINTELSNKPLPQQTQVADGFAGLLFDNIIAAMKDASVSSQSSVSEQPPEEVQPVAEASVSEQQPAQEVQQPTSNESAAQGLATLMMNSIMTGFNPSQVKDVKTKGSIYELFGEPITQETFTYGIGIINTNRSNKFEPELIRHYFLYKQPTQQPKIFRVDMGQQSFTNINDVFVGKLKTNKLIENYLTQKYVK